MKIKRLINVAFFGAIAFIIMLFEFSLPFFPFFLKIDLSEIPALLAGYTYGPAYGICVVFIKNLLHLFISPNLGIGELVNFLVGASFVGTGAMMYKRYHMSILKSLLCATVVMAIVAVIVNVFVVIPLYSSILKLPFVKILSLVQKIYPWVNNLSTYLVVIILPFNLIKGCISTCIFTMLSNKIKYIFSSIKGGV